MEHIWPTGAAWLTFKHREVPEHSVVVREAIGDDSDGSDADTLMCVTDYTPCCYTDSASLWFWDFKNVMVPHSSLDSNIFMSRGDQVLHLNRQRTASAEGIFWCRIRDTASTFRELYVGVYGNELKNNGESRNSF